MFLDFLAPHVMPPKVGLLSRFHKFFHGLLDSPSFEVQVLARLSARDIRTNIGKNLCYIEEETGLNPWVYGSNRIRDELRKRHEYVIDDRDCWRFPLLDKLLSQKQFAYYTGDSQLEEETTNLIYSLVTN